MTKCISVISSLQIDIGMLILGASGCKIKSFVHVQLGKGGLKLRGLSIHALWMTPLQCDKDLFKKLIFYGIEIPETYFSGSQLSGE